MTFDFYLAWADTCDVVTGMEYDLVKFIEIQSLSLAISLCDLNALGGHVLSLYVCI
jgi:hypothetical protein